MFKRNLGRGQGGGAKASTGGPSPEDWLAHTRPSCELKGHLATFRVRGKGAWAPMTEDWPWQRP